MNKQIAYLVATISVASLLVSCAILSNPQTEQTIITTAAAAGTLTDLQSRPADLPNFAAAEQELYTVADGTNQITATEIDTVLVQAGLTNKLEDLGLTTVVTLGNNYIISTPTTNSTVTTLKSVCGWIADGIAEETVTATAKLNAKHKAAVKHKK
jgi:hypothetical protein